MDIKKATNNACPSGYDRVFKGDWPGTEVGCNCLHVTYCRLRGVNENTLSKGSCSRNETRCGCRNVGEISASDFWIWPTNNEYCVKRDQSLSYENTYKNMFSDGSCKTGFTQCGNPSSTREHGICVPDGTNCPITSVKIATASPDTSKYLEILGENLNLYYSNHFTFGNPMADLFLREDHVCLSERERSLSPGREDYTLMRNSADGKCTRDTRFEDVGESLGERSLLIANAVPYQYLPRFYPSDNYQWKKVSRNVIAFQPRCRSLVESVLDIDVEVKAIDSRFKTAFVKKSKLSKKNEI